MGHLAGALACLEVEVPQDVGASQVGRLDVHSKGGLLGIQGLQAVACLGNHLDNPVVGRLA